MFSLYVHSKQTGLDFLIDLRQQYPRVNSLYVCLFIRLYWWCFTIEEDNKDAWVGELLSAQKVNVFYPQVKGQFDDGTILHVSGDVCHQSQVLHQTARLQIKTVNPH